MDCKKANELMMEFMDGTLSEENAALLGNHLKECKECEIDFEFYNQMIDEFSDMNNVIQAPDGFEESVMTKIDLIEPIYFPRADKTDNILCTIWGSISVAVGTGAIFTLNKDAISAFLGSVPQLSRYAEMLEPIEIYAEQFKIGLNTAINTITASVSGYASSLRYVSLIAFVLLIAAQYFIYRKDKVEV